ncbi:unnamed protein product, partial [Rotaria sp. Silwood1]
MDEVDSFDARAHPNYAGKILGIRDQ